MKILQNNKPAKPCIYWTRRVFILIFLQKSGFIVFPAGKPTPKYIQFLGKFLPAAVFGLLVIYCLRNVSLVSGSHGIPELISIAVVIGMHLWKRQMLISIAGGTICYMLLVQLVF